MNVYQIGIIPGTAPGAAEAVSAAMDALRGIGADVQSQIFDIGPERYLRDGTLLPADLLIPLRRMDAVLCGSPPVTSDPAIPPGVLERGIVFGLRRALELSVNLRIFRGAGDLREADIAIVRENSEGAYFGEGSTLHQGSAAEVVTEVAVTTRAAVDRCLRFGFGLARARRQRLTLAHKSKVLVASGGLWERAARAVGREYPEVTLAVENIDTCCARLIADPHRYDVMVTDNVFGDILSDVACAATRSAVYAASAELAMTGRGPSLFEPVHVAQDGPTGPGRASALGAINAAAMMLSRVGDRARGEALARAVMDFADGGGGNSHPGSLTDEVTRRARELMEERF